MKVNPKNNFLKFIFSNINDAKLSEIDDSCNIDEGYARGNVSRSLTGIAGRDRWGIKDEPPLNPSLTISKSVVYLLNVFYCYLTYIS